MARRTLVPRSSIALTLVALALAGSTGVAAAETISGRVELSEHGERIADVSGTVVYFVPEGGVKAGPPSAAEIQTQNRTFMPRVIVVPVGSTVRFPNGDPIKHNVFSVSPGNRFDLGLYGKGAGKAQRFDKPGLVRVFCNVHRTMSCSVWVLDTPYYATPGTDGSFTMNGVPAGRGTLRVWNPRAEEWSREVAVPARDPIVAVLDATLPPVPPHLDKFGRPYRDDRNEPEYR